MGVPWFVVEVEPAGDGPARVRMLAAFQSKAEAQQYIARLDPASRRLLRAVVREEWLYV